jgi:rsbT antagonist protein RsbS
MATKIPILNIEHTLLASIQTDLDDVSVVAFQDDLLERISTTGATGVIVDVTAVEVVDSFMARSLNDTAVAVHLLGAQLVVVGMQPSVAITMVRMRLTAPDALTALNLEKGLKLLRASATFKESWSAAGNAKARRAARHGPTHAEQTQAPDADAGA